MPYLVCAPNKLIMYAESPSGFRCILYFDSIVRQTGKRLLPPYRTAQSSRNVLRGSLYHQRDGQKPAFCCLNILLALPLPLGTSQNPPLGAQLHFHGLELPLSPLAIPDQVDLHLFLGRPLRNTPTVNFGTLDAEDADAVVIDDAPPPEPSDGYFGTIPEHMFQVASQS